MASNIVNVEDFSPAGDGESDDQIPLQNALNAAASGILLFPDSSKTYAIDGFGLTVRPYTRIINAGANLLVRGKAPRDSRASAIVAESGLQADYIRIRAASTSVVNRVLTLGPDTSIDRLEIASNIQQANRPGPTGQTDDHSPAALHIRGNRTTLGYVSIWRFDRALFARDVDHVTIQRADIREYTTGIHLKGCAYVELASGTITLASQSSVGDRNNHDTVKGMNGLLIETSSDIVVSNLIVQNSIEHGVRIGGDGPTRRCAFSNIEVRRAGWCGLKVQPPVERGGSAALIQINGLLVTDCAPQGETEAAPFKADGGRNRSGLRLESCQDVVVNGLQISRDEKELYSAYHGITSPAART